ncbi:MAG: hypothetical protein UH678_03730, partial [Fibrobacteraceae bacterium]|nr:hypothetical protein [Fibrobacteraceae bacterium]
LHSAMPTRTSAVVAALACLSCGETHCARSCQIANKFASAATLAYLVLNFIKNIRRWQTFEYFSFCL